MRRGSPWPAASSGPTRSMVGTTVTRAAISPCSITSRIGMPGSSLCTFKCLCSNFCGVTVPDSQRDADLGGLARLQRPLEGLIHHQALAGGYGGREHDPLLPLVGHAHAAHDLLPVDHDAEVEHLARGGEVPAPASAAAQPEGEQRQQADRGRGEQGTHACSSHPPRPEPFYPQARGVGSWGVPPPGARGPKGLPPAHDRRGQHARGRGVQAGGDVAGRVRIALPLGPLDVLGGARRDARRGALARGRSAPGWGARRRAGAPARAPAGA